MTFKVGDKVRRVHRGHIAGIMEVGTEAAVSGIVEGGRRVELNGDTEYAHDPDCLELIAPTGPVRTVTRREVVPGVWSGVVVERPTVAVNLHVHLNLHDPSSAELKAAAAVLLELAGALE